MILQSLKEMAHREHLLENPDYEPKPVAWIISLDKNGRFLGAISTVTDNGVRKKPGAKIMSIPRRRGRTSGASADFLVDKSEYVLGALPGLTDEENTEDLRARLKGRQQLFVAEVERAWARTGLRELKSCLSFLNSTSERALCARQMESIGYVSNDLIALEVDGTFLHEREEVQSYFSDSRRMGSANPQQCIICGEKRTPVEKHPGFQLRGGTTSGVPLVTFNADAFESQGWQRNENAPVCRDCADAYGTALKRLLSDRYQNPQSPAETLSKRSVGLSSDTTAVFWSDHEDSFVEMCADLFNQADPQAVDALLQSPLRGIAPGSDASRFFCLVITGSQGRAILRTLQSGIAGEVQRNVRAYFEAVRAISDRPAPLWALLRSLAVAGKADNVDPNLAGELFLAILFGRVFPRSVLAAACGRCRAEQSVSTQRAILLTAYFQSRKEREDVPMGLNKEQTDQGYRLGRLLAVLERLQARAQGNPNKTIVDRYYGAASTRPATVFPTLMSLSMHHAAKLEGGLANYFQSMQGEILSGMSSFPTTLTLEQQGLFALGYFHQRFQKSSDEKKPQAEVNVGEES